MTGSLILLAAGDVQSLGATIAFLCAEFTLTRFGHKTAGYSVGCALISSGGVALCFSNATAGNNWLKISILSVAFLWAVGALKYPIEKMGWYKTANLIQPVVGSLILIQRLPTLFFAFIGGSWVMFCATMFYIICDVLTGRIHQFACLVFKKAKNVC